MNNDDKKHFDIARPEGAPASHTSRPIIVGRQQLTHDPMMRIMNDGPKEENKDGEKPVLKTDQPHHEQTITPPEEVDAEVTHVESLPTDKQKSTATEETQTDESLPKTVIDHKDNPEPVQKLDKTQEMIDKKTYNLPIRQATSQRLLKVAIVIILMAIILGAGSIYFIINR